MPHMFPPEDPRSPASTFAPFQPGAGIVADDVDTDEENGRRASEVEEEFADKPLRDTGPGPDRAIKDPLHTVIPKLADDREEAERQAAGIVFLDDGSDEAKARRPQPADAAPPSDDKTNKATTKSAAPSTRSTATSTSTTAKSTKNDK